MQPILLSCGGKDIYRLNEKIKFCYRFLVFFIVT